MSIHMVTGPLAILKDSTGKQRYYYGGAILPEDLPADEVKRLVDTGLVSKIDDPLTVELAVPADTSVVGVVEPQSADPAPVKPSRTAAAKSDDGK